MKRKRVAKKKQQKTAAKKCLPKEPPVDVNQKEFLNFINHISEENAGSNECDNNSKESSSESESDTSSSSMMKSDGPINDVNPDANELERLIKKVVSGYCNAKSGTKNLSSTAKLYGNTKDFAVEHGKNNLKGSDSAERKRKSSKAQLPELKTSKIYIQEPQYHHEELKFALAVVKKVMKMDEAEPFNVPVDPIALGIPDYFNVIDKPMDFGTVCNNLHNGVKYKNADDVYEDVRCIWENCCKYNKKGDCILILMKRVKKKFMKYWTSAGLSDKQARENGNSYVPPSQDFASRHHKTEPRCQVGSMMGRPNQIQPDHSGPSHPCLWFPSPYQSQQPQQSTMLPQSSQWHADSGHIFVSGCQLGPVVDSSSQCKPPPAGLCRNQPHYLQQPIHNSSADTTSAGFSQLPTLGGFAIKHSRFVPQCHMVPNTGSLDQSQPQTSCNKPCCMQQIASQAKPTQSHAGANESAVFCEEHSPLQPYSNHTMRHNDNETRCPVDPPVANPSQLQSPHPTQGGSQPIDLQENCESFSQPQSSQSPAGADCADFSTRSGEHRESPVVGSVTNSSSKQPQVHLCTSQSQVQQPPPGLNQPYESQQPSQKKKRGRGPTQCLFLKDMADGERIVVPIDNQGQPMGRKSVKLTRFLGTIARDGHMAPLTYVSWKEMPEDSKEKMWKRIQSKFDIDPKSKAWLMKSLANKWGNWKSLLKKKHYYPHQTDDDRLKDRNARVLPDQWPVLISIWNSEKHQVRSARNKANRAKMKSAHTAGSKSYARIIEEERAKKPSGQGLTQEELYILTHTRKNGQPVSEKAAEVIKQLQERVQQQKRAEGSAAGGNISSQDLREARQSEIHGSAVTPIPFDLGSQTPHQNEPVRTAPEANKPSSIDVSKILEKMEAMEQKYSHMETLVTRMSSNMESFKNHVRRAPSKTSGTKQVNALNGLEDSPQPQPHSSSSSHVVPSQEAVYRS